MVFVHRFGPCDFRVMSETYYDIDCFPDMLLLLSGFVAEYAVLEEAIIYS